MPTISRKHTARQWSGAWLLALFLGVIGLIFSGSAYADENVLKKASLFPLWSPQAQFAGYYVALDKGLYARHGLEMTIISGGPERSPVESLQKGEADFAVLWLVDALQQRAGGGKLINVAQLVQRSSTMLVARKSSGIRTPADLAGRKVGVWEGVLGIPARIFLNNYHLQVKEIPQSYTVNLFLRGGVEVVSAMWYNEYHTLMLSGLDSDELNVFALHDYGVDLPEDGLYTLAETLRQDPELVAAFVRASLEGWDYAFTHPDEAIDIVLKYMREAKVPANRIHQRWMLARMEELIKHKNSPRSFGRLAQSDYEAVGEVLRKHGLLPVVPPYQVFVGETDAVE